MKRKTIIILLLAGLLLAGSTQRPNAPDYWAKYSMERNR